MAHNKNIRKETTPLDVQIGNNLAMSAADGGTQKEVMCSAQQGHGPHEVEEKEMDDMEEEQLSIVPAGDQFDVGVGGKIDPPDMHNKFKVALSIFRKTDLMSAFTTASSSTCISSNNISIDQTFNFFMHTFGDAGCEHSAPN